MFDNPYIIGAGIAIISIERLYTLASAIGNRVKGNGKQPDCQDCLYKICGSIDKQSTAITDLVQEIRIIRIANR